MIIGSSFVWIHLPKTGGTSTAVYLRSLDLKGVATDPDDDDRKHESAEVRSDNMGGSLLGKSTYITSRRLSRWLLSDWHHKTQSMNIDIPFEPVRSGLFYSLRLGGIWTSADYWIQYFQAHKCHGVIRLEHLDEDANRFIHPHLPSGTPVLQFPKHNVNEYSRHIGDFFSTRDLNRIYTNNPLWSAWEEQVYGSRTELPLPERLRSLRRGLR